MDAWTVASGILLAGVVVVAAYAVLVGAVSSIAWRSNHSRRTRTEREQWKVDMDRRIARERARRRAR